MLITSGTNKKNLANLPASLRLRLLTKILYSRYTSHFLRLKIFGQYGFLNLLKISIRLYLFDNKPHICLKSISLLYISVSMRVHNMQKNVNNAYHHNNACHHNNAYHHSGAVIVQLQWDDKIDLALLTAMVKAVCRKLRAKSDFKNKIQMEASFQYFLKATTDNRAKMLIMLLYITI